MKTAKLTKTELIISFVLKLGVAISATFITFGLVLFFAHTGQNGNPLSAQSYKHFASSGYSFPHSLISLRTSLAAGQGAGYIMLGALLLILTPILRVASSVILFLRQKDTPMTAVTLFVLAILLGSFVLGLAVK